jgi:DNA-binding protein HU-beta
MKKADLVEKIAGACEISKVQPVTAVDTAVESITGALRKGDRVARIGLGTFSVSQRKARNGQNPQTSAPTRMAAKKVANSSPGRRLKKADRNPVQPGDAFVKAMEELSEYYS